MAFPLTLIDSIRAMNSQNMIKCSIQTIYILLYAFLVISSETSSENLTGYKQYCVTSKNTVDCSDQKLSNITENLPPWIERLKLSKNNFISIPDLSHMKNLAHLSLGHNKINEITQKTMENMGNLVVLDLNNNIITEIQENTFVNCTNLKSLNLNNNHISNIDIGAFNGLKNLQDLKLSFNKLTKLNKEIFKPLIALKILELNGSQISEIVVLSYKPLEYSPLTVLRLQQNFIEELADGAFYGMDKLLELHLDYNKLTRISNGWLFGLSSLNYLNVSHNQIILLNKGWDLCPHLIKLDISNNKLEAIEEGTFKYLEQLKVLNIRNNRLSYIEEGAFNFVPSLRYLDLSDNFLSWIVENPCDILGGLKQLSVLNMANNMIRLLKKDSFKGLESITEIDLSTNEISRIEGDVFVDLTYLYKIHVNTTSLICDCTLIRFIDWLSTTNGSVITAQDNLQCIHPTALKRKPLQRLDRKFLICSWNNNPDPRIIVNSSNTDTLVGNNVTLRCGANSTSDDDMEFLWKLNNIKLENVDVKKKESAQNGGVAQFSDLQLYNVAMVQSGLYQCVVANHFGVAYSTLSKLSVLVFPTFRKTPANVVVQVGGIAKFECIATGFPQPNITWQKDGGSNFPAAQERRMKVMSGDEQEPFYIVNVKMADVGLYTCMASNEAGTATANATITVHEPPSFIKTVKSKEVYVGEAATMECMAVGLPKPKIVWIKDNKKIISGARHFLTADDQLLIITDTKISDSGIYECEVSNVYGSDSSSLQLIVLFPHKNGITYEEIIGIIIISVVVCIVCTSTVWVIVIYQTRKRHRKLRSQLSPVDNRSDDSCHSSKDSGTGDSTKRSYQDILAAVNINRRSALQLHDERSDAGSSPEVTMPLLTTFHPISTGNSTTTSSIRDQCASKSNIHHSSTLSPLHMHSPPSISCPSPASSSGVQCTCLTSTFKKKTDVCDCLSSGSPSKKGNNVRCILQNEHERCCNDNNKRPCSIPVPYHSSHSSHTCNSYCRHTNSYLCFYNS